MVLASILSVGSVGSIHGEKGVSPNRFSDPVLLVSNTPERLSEPGILVDYVLGNRPVSLWYHHLNEGRTTLGLSLGLKNRSDRPVSVLFSWVKGGPSVDAVHAGHVVSRGVLMGAVPRRRVTLMPGATYRFARHAIKVGQVSAGMFEVFAARPDAVQMTLTAFGDDYPELNGLNTPEIPYRFGRFDESIRRVRVSFQPEDKIKEVEIGGEPYLRDAGAGITMLGNYGLVYDISLDLNNPENAVRKVRLWISPAGGVVRASLLIDGRMVETGLFSNRNQLKPQKVAEFLLKPRESRRVNIKTLPQPGSFYPINLVIRSGELATPAE